MCKYSIKATSFCGVYVDGDRERIPYEADAYINQLCHYGVDSEYEIARYSLEYLIQYPSWPTEWHLHAVLMAWADYMYAGQTATLKEFYDELKIKTLIGLAREDGLISSKSQLRTKEFEKSLNLFNPRYIHGSHGLRDVIDWPPGERDGYKIVAYNTVVNAFHYHTLVLMSRIAEATEHQQDQRFFAKQAVLVKDTMNRLFFDEERGIYVDGEGTKHASLHANMFMLAFEMVPDNRKESVISFVKSRGMACSVYGAQYLLEALYLNNEQDYALSLMTSQSDRSWWNMIQSGSTISMEAWDLKYKKNLDWNHAWGAVPANIIPRYLLGVRPLEPGFRKVLIQPQPGALMQASGRIPTIHGPVTVSFQDAQKESYTLAVDIPTGITAKIELPQRDKTSRMLIVNDKKVKAEHEGGCLYLDNIAPGKYVIRYNGCKL
jgi:hypothetical protein